MSRIQNFNIPLNLFSLSPLHSIVSVHSSSSSTLMSIKWQILCLNFLISILVILINTVLYLGLEEYFMLILVFIGLVNIAYNISDHKHLMVKFNKILLISCLCCLYFILIYIN